MESGNKPHPPITTTTIRRSTIRKIEMLAAFWGLTRTDALEKAVDASLKDAGLPAPDSTDTSNQLKTRREAARKAGRVTSGRERDGAELANSSAG